jgi:hypothetical protein
MNRMPLTKGPDLQMRWKAGTLILLGRLAVGAQAAEFYVALGGDDANPGTAEQPFATFERARQAVRQVRAQGGALTEPVLVLIRGGEYKVTQTLELTGEDSGTEASPTLWQAFPGEEVRLIGGRRLMGFQPVSDPAIRERLQPEARQHVLEVDLPALGITDLGPPTPSDGPPAQLVFNHRYMPLARYPNAGEWLRIRSIPQGTEGETKIETEYDSHWGRFAYDDDRPERWKDVEDLWVHGYWVYDWSDQYQRVQKLDLEKREVWPEPPYHHYGYRQGQRFYFLNVLEELDSPGEWFLDRDRGRLYFWPPEPLDGAEVFFPEFNRPMVTITGAEHVHLRGLTFEAARDAAIVISGGAHNEIAGCTIRNFAGRSAVRISGTHNGIRSSDVYEVSGIGIELSGGDRQTLTPAHNYAENCEVHHVGQVWRTYHGAFSLQGVGQRISHCYVHDVPHQGIGYGGNDHLIEFCDFTRIATETGDVGVIYTGADWTYMGHEFRYNYFHNIHGPGQLGCFTIYPDLPCGGIYLHGNIFYDVDVGFYTNSGRGMFIENNLFLGARWAIGFGVWKQESMFKEGGAWRMVENLAAVHYDQPPYGTRYPALRRLAEDFARGEDQWLQRAIPRDNLIRCNISDTDLFLRLGAEASLDDVQAWNNLIADATVFTGSFTGDGESRTYRNGDPQVAAELGKRGNLILQGDPLGDLESQDFRPPPDSPAWELGFKPIPFDQIGLYVDAYRQALPLRVSPPTITPPGQAFTGEMTIRLIPTPQAGQPKCVIRYTLDGSEPTEASPAYSEPIRLTATTILKAAAFVESDGRKLRSPTVSQRYRAAKVEEGAVFLSDLPEEDLFAYPACWKKDENYQGGPIRLGGLDYPKGLLLHPDLAADGKGIAYVTYALQGGLANAQHFGAVIGIDDSMEAYHQGSATFIVEVHRAGRWERLFESGVIRQGDMPQEVQLDIAGADKLRLIATDAGDGISCDHATWAEARVW